MLADELAWSGYADTALETDSMNWAAWEAFCDRHGAKASRPTGEVVVAFLAERPGMRHSYASRRVESLRARIRQLGGTGEKWPVVDGYLGALKRIGPEPRERISPLTDAEVHQVAAHAATPRPEITDLALRRLVALARVGAVPTWSEVEGLDVAAGPNGDLTYRGRRLEIEAESVEYGILTRDGDIPAGTCSLQAGALRARVRGAARRAGLRLSSPSEVRALSAEDFHRLLVHCDPTRDRRVRNLAWFALGIHHALRQISLANLLIEDVRVTHDGYEVTYRVAKLRAGQVQVRSVPHVEPDVEMCGADPMCPACGLEDQLEVCRRQGRTSGPVFATHYAGKWGVMTRQNARHLIRELVLSALPDLDPSRLIATRTLRVTTSTALVRSGATFAETAAITMRYDEAELARYVRLGIEDEVHPVYDFN
ncbi:hypothetical protein [Arthrobacter sp. NEB 688]|uniref:hypothetical protein n=1 Tax=Arthrobacter sp. NEB 688 TaxID=904039 RepID=UPI001564B852|nr:hypothetical protein [Arthrobacter sp. NEB 688]QKE82882.1 hypothetical protein HL663_02230 [Arthrobacter sp. NEB 688]